MKPGESASRKDALAKLRLHLTAVNGFDDPLTPDELCFLMLHKTDDWPIGDDLRLVRMVARTFLSEQQRRWIRCDERLPELGETVIVQGGIAYRKHPDGAWFTLTGETYPGRPIQWEVNHWIPIPAAPQPAERKD